MILCQVFLLFPYLFLPFELGNYDLCIRDQLSSYVTFKSLGPLMHITFTILAWNHV